MADGLLLIDDHYAIAQALAVALRSAGFDPVEALRADELDVRTAVAAATRLGAAVALVDLNLGPAGSGLPFVPALTAAGVKVIVFSASNATSDVAASLRAGARGYLNKAEPFDVITDYAQRAGRGENLIDPDERDRLVHSADAEAVDRLERFLTLTDRERAVLAALAEGHTPKEIAKASSTAIGTVRTQIEKIRTKLAVQNQLAAVSLYRELERHHGGRS